MVRAPQASLHHRRAVQSVCIRSWWLLAFDHVLASCMLHATTLVLHKGFVDLWHARGQRVLSLHAWDPGIHDTGYGPRLTPQNFWYERGCNAGSKKRSALEDRNPYGTHEYQSMGCHLIGPETGVLRRSIFLMCSCAMGWGSDVEL